MRKAVVMAIPIAIVSFILVIVFEFISLETNNDTLELITKILYRIFWVILIISVVIIGIGEIAIRIKLLNLLN